MENTPARRALPGCFVAAYHFVKVVLGEVRRPGRPTTSLCRWGRGRTKSEGSAVVFRGDRGYMNNWGGTRFAGIPLSLVLLCAFAVAQDSSEQTLDREYQAAVSDYEAGRLPQAAEELEKLLPHAPRSYELHELLGMVYASLSENDKAIEQLKT